MQHPDNIQKLVRVAFLASLALVIVTGTVWGITVLIAHRNQTTAAQTANNAANLPIGGFPMSGDLAPDFKLIDQFGKTVTLSSLRGQEVVMSFIDSRCKDVCPLTAEIMYDAKVRLNSSTASHVALIAVNANPTATSIATVQAWSISHGMLHQWLFLTGTAKQLESVYQMYHVYVQVTPNGQDVHDAATIIIDPKGHERLFFETVNSNSKSDLGSEITGLEAGMQQWLPQP